jgi:hypothetical protein
VTTFRHGLTEAVTKSAYSLWIACLATALAVAERP